MANNQPTAEEIKAAVETFKAYEHIWNRAAMKKAASIIPSRARMYNRCKLTVVEVLEQARLQLLRNTAHVKYLARFDEGEWDEKRNGTRESVIELFANVRVNEVIEMNSRSRESYGPTVLHQYNF